MKLLVDMLDENVTVIPVKQAGARVKYGVQLGDIAFMDRFEIDLDGAIQSIESLHFGSLHWGLSVPPVRNMLKTRQGVVFGKSPQMWGG